MNGQTIYNIVKNSQQFKFIPQILILQVENIDGNHVETERNFDVSIDELVNKISKTRTDSFGNKNFNFFKGDIRSSQFISNSVPQKKNENENENLFYKDDNVKEEDEDEHEKKKSQIQTNDVVDSKQNNNTGNLGK
jgi:hypothetical protein